MDYTGGLRLQHKEHDICLKCTLFEEDFHDDKMITCQIETKKSLKSARRFVRSQFIENEKRSIYINKCKCVSRKGRFILCGVIQDGGDKYENDVTVSEKARKEILQAFKQRNKDTEREI